MLDASYGEGVDEQLDAVENDSSRTELWNGICETLDLILSKPDSADTRTHSMRVEGGGTAWRVPIPVFTEDQNWSVIWSRDGNEAIFLYVGPWPPA